MGDTTGIGDRFKRYERSADYRLIRRMPAIIRVDGRAFHSFTRGMNRPFDLNLHEAMMQAGMRLAEDIHTAALVYGQSDEISVLLVDYAKLQTEQWFGGCVQKIASIAASIATASFARSFMDKPAPQFDARVFNVPEPDAPNYFYWRWQDAVRNSVSSAAQAKFSHKQLHGVTVSQMKEKLRYEADAPWEDMPPMFKDGWLIRKTPCEERQRYKWECCALDSDIRVETERAIRVMTDDFQPTQETQDDEPNG